MRMKMPERNGSEAAPIFSSDGVAAALIFPPSPICAAPDNNFGISADAPFVRWIQELANRLRQRGHYVDQG